MNFKQTSYIDKISKKEIKQPVHLPKIRNIVNFQISTKPDKKKHLSPQNNGNQSKNIIKKLVFFIALTIDVLALLYAFDPYIQRFCECSTFSCARTPRDAMKRSMEICLL